MDESDKLFEDGKSGFRDQLATIFLACTSHLVRRALFSATFAHDVEEWCKLNLDSVVLVSVGARWVCSCALTLLWFFPVAVFASSVCLFALVLQGVCLQEKLSACRSFSHSGVFLCPLLYHQTNINLRCMYW